MTTEGFKGRLVSAIGWSVAMKAGFQLLSWVLTLVVIRVLSPSDYGLMAISQVFTTFVLGFASLGLGDALVQRDDPSRSLVQSVFGVSILLAAGLMAVLCLSAYPIAALYHDPRLVALIQVSSLGALFNVLALLPRTFLQKQLRVRPIFVSELSAGLVSSVVVVVLAFHGYGVWSLMLGGVVGAVAKQAAFFYVGAEFYVWPRFDVALVRPLLGFGAYATLEYLAFMLMISADVLIIGWLLSPAELGVYTVVLNFAAMPLNKIAPIINQISFPAFAMVQSNPAEARYYVLKGIRLMALLVVPVFLGIGAVAPEVVDIVFGPPWAAARPLLPILSAALIFRALLILLPKYLQGIGEAKAAFWCTGIGAVAFPLAVLVGCRWGLAGACWAWLVSYPAVFAAEALIAARPGSLPFQEVMRAPLRPMVAGLVMVAAVVGLRAALPAGWPDVARLICLAALGAAVYGAMVSFAFPALGGELRNLFRRGGASHDRHGRQHRRQGRPSGRGNRTPGRLPGGDVLSARRP